MQTKLLIASLAALTDLGLAQTTDDTGVVRQLHRDTLLSFISNMVACDVEIDKINLNYAQRQGGKQDNYLEFTLKNTEGCPPLKVEAWIESNSDIAEDAAPVERQTWTSKDVDAIVGKFAQAAPTFKNMRQTSTAGGELNAHIRIFDETHDDDGGEWTIPLLTHCESKAVPIKCPEFSNLKNNLYYSEYDPEVVHHAINFEADNATFLELCHVAAVVSVFHEGDDQSKYVTKDLSQEALKAFFQNENSILNLQEPNQIGKRKCAQVNFINIDTQEKFPQLGPLCQDDMTAPCVIEAIHTIDSCTPDHDNHTLTVKSHSEITNFNRVCKFRLGSSIESNVETASGDNRTSSTEKVNSAENSVAKYVQVISDIKWDTIPAVVTSNVTLGTTVVWAKDFTCPMDCIFQNASIFVGDEAVDYGVQDIDGKLYHVLDYELNGSYSDWCGPIIGNIAVLRDNGDADDGYVMMIPISSKDMENFYRNDDGSKTITGKLNLPFQTGNHVFKFTMDRVKTHEQKVTSTQYLENGAQCVLDVNFNSSKQHCDSVGQCGPLVSLPRYDDARAVVILEGTYLWMANTVNKIKVDPRFCNLDVLELGYSSKNFNSFLADPKTGNDIKVVFPKTNDLKDPSERDANNQGKINLFNNGVSHYVELDRQDVVWTANLWFDYECVQDGINVCTKYFIEEPDRKLSPGDFFTWKWTMSCTPKIKVLEFSLKNSDVAGSERAESYFTYELGGSLQGCGCDASGSKVSSNLTATYDLIREGTGFTDLDFAPVYLTRQQILDGIRPENDKNWKAPSIDVSFVRQDGDYKIQMTFAELVDPKKCGVKTPAQTNNHSNHINIINLCNVFISDFNFKGSYCSNKVEEIRHKFEISYATTRYCEFTVAQVVINELPDQPFKLPLSEQTNFGFEIVQSEKLAQHEYTASATVTSIKPYAKEASLTVEKTGRFDNRDCNCSVRVGDSHTLNLIGETHSTFDVEQSLSWTLGNYCYGQTLSLEMTFDGQPAKKFSVAEQGYQQVQWHKQNAVSGEYSSDYMFYLGSNNYAHQPASINWVQSCVVDIKKGDIVALGYADPETQTGTYLDIAINTTVQGNCGSGDWLANLTIQKKLDCDLAGCDMSDAIQQEIRLDNAIVNNSIESQDFLFRVNIDDDGDACYSTKLHISAFEREGARVDLPISRPEEFYAGMMKCYGYQEVCTPTIDEFDWTKDPEEVDGVVTPQFDIKLSIDKPHSKWCQNRNARVYVFDGEGIKVGSYKDLTQEEIASALTSGLTFTWDSMTPEDQKYYSQLTWVVSDGQDEEFTGKKQVYPKCHISVEDFTISNPRILDQDAKAEFDVDWHFKHNSANFCKDETAILTLADKDSEKVLFEFNLSENDIITSLTSSGMGLTPRIDFVSGQTITASIKYEDTNMAGKAATATAEAHGPTVSEYCDIVVETFCLRGKEEREGQEVFVFDIKVDKSTVCGALTIGMDIIHEDKYADVPQIGVDPVIVDKSNSCECSVEIVVPTAGWILSGDFYGQIDIREAKSNLIIVQDSTHFTF